MADKHTLADGPPSPMETIAHMHWLLVDKTWQASIFQQMDLPSLPLRNNSIYAWTTSRQNLAGSFICCHLVFSYWTGMLWQMDPPSPKRAGMPWILVHQHWQRTVLWHHPTTTTTRYTRLRHEISNVTLRWSVQIVIF